MTDLLTADEVRDRLRAACEAAGGQAAWARQHDMTKAYVSGVLNGLYQPARAICHALKLKAVVLYKLDDGRDAA